RMIETGEVLDQALAHLPRQVQAREAGIFLLQHFDDAKALAVMLEAAMLLHQPVERRLASVAEGRMAEVMRQRDGLSEVFIELEGAADIAGDGSDFHRVGEPGAQMI